MTEDPLERIEREEREKKERNNGLKTTTIVLALVAVALGGALAWTMMKNRGMVRELETDKAALTEQVMAFRDSLSTMHSNYDDINAQLDTSREQVALLIEKLSKTEASNRAQMRRYEKELGTLRSIMKGYIVQIDSLNTLNKRLTADAAAARREAAEARQANENLAQQVAGLNQQVSAGKTLKARGISLVGHMSNDKASDRHSRVKYLTLNLSLLENEIAERGPVTIYVRIKDPNDILLVNNASTSFTVGGQTLQASASREVDYEGGELDVTIYMNDVDEYVKGIYTAEAYTAKGLLGKAELMLR